MNEQITYLALDDIIPHPGNRRIGGFNQERLEQLADSIRAVGVQQPAVIRKAGENGKYELVAGERRWRAARIAGLEALPCVIRELSDIEVLKICTIENLQREDIHPLDEADGYQRLIEAAGYDVEHIAGEVGRSVSYVYQRLKLRDLIPGAREALIDGKITSGHAILIARLQPEQQTEALGYCEPRWRDAPSVRELDGWIHSQVLMLLDKASFKKDDPDLLPYAGPCTTCSKRTGFMPALFPEIGEKDHCTDPTCFNGKLDALVVKQREESREKGEKILEVSDGYGYWNPNQKPKDVLELHQWQECRKKDEGALRCLVVTGPQRGRFTWGKKIAGGYGPELTPEEKEKQKKEKKEQREKAKAREDLWMKVIEGAEELISEQKRIPEFLLREIVLEFFNRLWDEHRKRLCGIAGWERPPKENYKNSWDRPGFNEVGRENIRKMEASELPVFLVRCALIRYIDLQNIYYPGEPEEKDGLEELARELGLYAEL